MMDRSYIPPVISGELGRTAPHVAEDRNFYARGPRAPTLFQIDGLPVIGLIEEFGSPLFVFSEYDIRAKAKRMREAFRSRYKKTSFAWSLKTNYLGAICRILQSEGWSAEVVSQFEYEKARQIGFAGNEIVFNGPYKPRAAMQTAIEDGALIQIDNWDELSTAEELVAQHGKTVAIGLRVWLDPDIKPVWSKFGFALENGEAERAAARILENPKLQLHTLHCHIGTYILAPSAYAVTAKKLLHFREELRHKYNYLVPCLNLGGGFPSNSLLYGFAGPAEQVVPPIEAFATAITDVLRELPPGEQPLLRLESGRYLVDEAGYLLSTVIAVKGANRLALTDGGLSARAYKERMILNEDSRIEYVIDAGINLLYTSAWYQFEILPARTIDAPPVTSRIYGSLCMAIDVIRDHVDLPPLETGDILTIHPVGAYNVTQWMQFIQYRPAVVLISSDGKADIIRTRETLEDVTGPERMPEHLSR
jgi:diaminopimelate decarboxylase